MLRSKGFWIVLIVLVLLGGGGYGAYAYWFAPEKVVLEETTLQTATITVGGLSITADGSGILVASSEIELAFGATGTLMELLVEVGDHVQAGDVLGWIDDTDARKSVADAELGLLQAKEALEEARDTIHSRGQCELCAPRPAGGGEPDLCDHRHRAQRRR